MSIPPTSFQEYYANLNNLIPKGSICINGYVYSVDTKDDKVVLTSLDVTTQELMATAEVPKENGQKYHIDHMGTNEWFLLSYFEDNTRRFRLVTIKKDGSFMVGPPTEAYVVPTDGIKSRFVKTDSATAEVAWKEQSDGADSKAIIYDLSGNLPAQPAATVDFAVGEVVSTDKQVVLVGENNQVGVYNLGTGEFRRYATTGYVKTDMSFQEFEVAQSWRGEIFILNGDSQLWRLNTSTWKWTLMDTLPSFPEVHISMFFLSGVGQLLLSVYDYYLEQPQLRSYWILIPSLFELTKMFINDSKNANEESEEGRKRLTLREEAHWTIGHLCR